MCFVTFLPPLLSHSTLTCIALSAALISRYDRWKGPFFPHGHCDSRNTQLMKERWYVITFQRIAPALEPAFPAVLTNGQPADILPFYLCSSDHSFLFVLLVAGEYLVWSNRSSPLTCFHWGFQHQTVAMRLICSERARLKWTMAYFKGFKTVSYYNGESQGFSLNPISGPKKKRQSTLSGFTLQSYSKWMSFQL